MDVKRVQGRPGVRSLLAVLIIMTACAGFQWKQPPGNPITWDTCAYYLYLPAVFLHGDPALRDTAWLNDAQERYNVTGGGVLYQANRLKNGAQVIKVSMGLSLLWAPFFALGHVWAGVIGAPQDGFSAPYGSSLIIGGCIYLLIGLLLLRLVLKRYFTDGIVALTILLIALGTNWAHHALFGLLMPHILLFNFVALLLWNTLRWHEEQRAVHAVGIAVALGVLALSRPTDIMAVLIPMLWGMDLRARTAWPMRGALFRLHGRQVALMLVILLLFALPQMIYWRVVTGDWVHMSYAGAEEGFDFFRPHLFNVLFSFRKGWFIYTPLMAVAAAGFFWLKPGTIVPRPALLVYLLVNLWVVASWSNWWYATSFGHRAVVESYAVMAFGLGAFLTRFANARMPWRAGGALFITGLVAFNIFQLVQFDKEVLHGDRMTFAYYRAVFGQLSVPAGAKELLSVDHGKNEAHDFDGSRYDRVQATVLNSESGFKGRLSDMLLFDDLPAMLMDSADSFSPTFHHPFAELTDQDHLWVHAWTDVFVPAGCEGIIGSLVVTMEHNGQNYAYRTQDISAGNAKADEWNRIEVKYLTPEIRSGGDPLIVYYWHRSTNAVWIGDVVVQPYERNTP